MFVHIWPRGRTWHWSTIAVQKAQTFWGARAMACSPVPKVGGTAAPSAPPVPTPMPWAGPNSRGVSQMCMEDKIWEKEKFWDWNERMMGWWMTRVVMVTLTRWGDHRSMVSRLGSISPNRIFRLIAFCLIFFWFWRTNNDLIVVFCFFDKLCLVVHHFFCRGLPFFGRP